MDSWISIFPCGETILVPASKTNSGNKNSAGSVVIGLLGVVFFLLACFFVGSRAHIQQQQPGKVADQGGPRAGFKTFQDEIYFPVRAMITGVNPYTDHYQDFHPDQFSATAVSPTTLALATPLGFISVLESQWTYLLLCFLLSIVTAWIIFRSGGVCAPLPVVLIVAGLMIICRPGMSELLGVGLVFPVVFGFALALEYAHRSGLIAGLGFLITTCSLVFAAPLAVLMLFRRDFRGLGYGLLLTLAVWVTIALVLARGDTRDLRTICTEDFAKPIGVLFQDPDGRDVDRTCWERIDLSPPVTKIVEGDFFDVDSNKTVEPTAIGSPPMRDKFRRGDGSVSLPVPLDTLIGLAYFPRGLHAYNGPIELGSIVALVCLAFGGLCLLLEKRCSQREGLASRTGLLIVLITLLAFPHTFSDGVLIWLPLVGLLVGFRKLVVGLNWFVRFLVMVVLVVFVFNFLSPQLLMEPGFMGAIPLDSWQMNVLASLNPILLTVAAVLVGSSCLASQLFAGDPKESSPQHAETSPTSTVSQRQSDWQKLRGK